MVERFLKERGLKLSPEKTHITHIKEGFDFLGQNLRKYDGKPLSKPSKKNVKAFMEKIRRIIDKNKSVSQATIIDRLNPVIRGWANYHRHIVATDTFGRVDHELWRKLWKWAQRRHPRKQRDWIKRKYFPWIGNRCWTFACDSGKRNKNGKPIWKRLAYAKETKIKRHVKIHGSANPYDPA